VSVRQPGPRGGRRVDAAPARARPDARAADRARVARRARPRARRSRPTCRTCGPRHGRAPSAWAAPARSARPLPEDRARADARDGGNPRPPTSAPARIRPPRQEAQDDRRNWCREPSSRRASYHARRPRPRYAYACARRSRSSPLRGLLPLRGQARDRSVGTAQSRASQAPLKPHRPVPPAHAGRTSEPEATKAPLGRANPRTHQP